LGPGAAEGYSLPLKYKTWAEKPTEYHHFEVTRPPPRSISMTWADGKDANVFKAVRVGGGAVDIIVKAKSAKNKRTNFPALLCNLKGWNVELKMRGSTGKEITLPVTCTVDGDGANNKLRINLESICKDCAIGKYTLRLKLKPTDTNCAEELCVEKPLSVEAISGLPYKLRWQEGYCFPKTLARGVVHVDCRLELIDQVGNLYRHVYQRQDEDELLLDLDEANECVKLVEVQSLEAIESIVRLQGKISIIAPYQQGGSQSQVQFRLKMKKRFAKRLVLSDDVKFKMEKRRFVVRIDRSALPEGARLRGHNEGGQVQLLTKKNTDLSQFMLLIVQRETRPGKWTVDEGATGTPGEVTLAVNGKRVSHYSPLLTQGEVRIDSANELIVGGATKATKKRRAGDDGVTSNRQPEKFSFEYSGLRCELEATLVAGKPEKLVVLAGDKPKRSQSSVHVHVQIDGSLCIETVAHDSEGVIVPFDLPEMQNCTCALELSGARTANLRLGISPQLWPHAAKEAESLRTRKICFRRAAAEEQRKWEQWRQQQHGSSTHMQHGSKRARAGVEANPYGIDTDVCITSGSCCSGEKLELPYFVDSTSRRMVIEGIKIRGTFTGKDVETKLKVAVDASMAGGSMLACDLSMEVSVLYTIHYTLIHHGGECTIHYTLYTHTPWR
jgi:hypothetical protein